MRRWIFRQLTRGFGFVSPVDVVGSGVGSGVVGSGDGSARSVAAPIKATASEQAHASASVILERIRGSPRIPPPRD
jgi:hypothetical protein